MKTLDLSHRARQASQLLASGGIHRNVLQHLLVELAHELDATDIHATHKADGLLLTNGVGMARYATWREALAYRLCGSLPKRL